MKSNELDTLWQSLRSTEPANQETIKKLVSSEQKKHRWSLLILANMGLNLLAFSTLLIWALATERSAISQAWPALLTLLVLWATYSEIVRYRIVNRSFYQESIRSVLRVSLSRVEGALRETKILQMVTVIAIIPLVLISLSFLLDADLMSAREGLSFALFSASILAINLFTISYLRTRKLIPKLKLLKNRLDSI
ncbi:MAG: hypothetical protein AAFX93_10675 [Verrucomicrobiota bacterium]